MTLKTLNIHSPPIMQYKSNNLTCNKMTQQIIKSINKIAFLFYNK